MIDTVLVGVTATDAKLTGPSAEALTAARAIATDVHAVWLADGEADLEALGQFGAATVWVPGEPVNLAVTAAAAHLVGQAAEQAGAGLIVLPSTFAAKDIAGELAAASGSGAVVDATAVELDGEDVVATKSVLAGTWTTTCAALGPRPIITLKPNSVPAAPADNPAQCHTEQVAVQLPERAARVRVVSSTPHEHTSGVPLDQAATVVVGGRGVEGDFTQVAELADVLGGAVGATRVATDEGWIEHAAQIGQTGTMISPRLYIGCGVSGAIHHTAGMQAAQTIVAINNDPDAPLMEMADLAIVGDVNDVVPQAIEHLRGGQG